MALIPLTCASFDVLATMTCVCYILFHDSKRFNLTSFGTFISIVSWIPVGHSGRPGTEIGMPGAPGERRGAHKCKI